MYQKTLFLLSFTLSLNFSKFLTSSNTRQGHNKQSLSSEISDQLVFKITSWDKTQQENLLLYSLPSGIPERKLMGSLSSQNLIIMNSSISAVQLLTKINITYGDLNTNSSLILYNLYLYTKQINSNEHYLQDYYIQLLYGAQAGQIMIYVPLGDSCTIICSTQDDSFIQSQQINISYQQNLSISDAINSSINLWQINNTDTFQNNFVIISIIIYSLKYMNDQNYCNLGCSVNGQCGQNNICQCYQGFNFFDCSGNVDDAIRYNVFLGTLLGNLIPSQIYSNISDQNLSLIPQIQILTTFLLKNCQIGSIYYNINLSQITQTLLSVINGSLQFMESDKTQNLPVSIDYGNSSASKIIQGISLIDLIRITDLFAQVLQFADTMRNQFSNEEIDKNISQFENIFTFKSQTILAIEYIKGFLVESKDDSLLDQVIINQGISFYKIIVNGSQLINFFSRSFLNFSSLLQSPSSIYNQLSAYDDSISTSTPFNQNQEYFILMSTIEQNPYSFSDNFYYPSQSLSYVLIQIFDKISLVQIQIQPKNDIQLVIWFSTNQEFKNSRSLRNQNGNYLCVQQDMNRVWSHNGCTTKYISVLYVVCNCSALGAITLIDDYNYIIMPHPVQPKYLLPINVILYIWVPLTSLWIILSLWGYLQDQEESEDNVEKRKLETEKLRRASIKRISQSLGLVRNSLNITNMTLGQITQKKPDISLDINSSPKNIIGPNGKILVDALSIDELQLLQDQFVKAIFPNIQLRPTSIMKAQYTPKVQQIKEEEISEKNKNYVYVMNVLNTHTSIGALLKYKPTISRAYRLAMVFQRMNIVLLSTGYFVALGLPSLFVVCLCCQIFSILYRIIEQINRESIKMSLKNYKYGTLYRLLNYIGQIIIIGLQMYLFSELFSQSDGIYVEDWVVTLVLTLTFDQIIVESIILSIRLLYRKKMRMIKFTSKFEQNKISVSFVMPPNDFIINKANDTNTNKIEIDKIKTDHTHVDKVDAERQNLDPDNSKLSMSIFNPNQSRTIFNQNR